MHIPEQFETYKKPTLLAVTDSEHAKLYLLNNRNMTFLEEVSIDYPQKDNMGVRETDTMTPAGILSAHTEEKLDLEKERRFSHALSQVLMHELQKGTYEELILAIPHEHVNEFIESLHNDVKSRLVKTVPKLLTKQPEEELIEHIQN